MTSGTEDKSAAFRVGTTGDIPIELTRDELAWLNDKITGQDLKYNGEGWFPVMDVRVFRSLRLKIASGFLESLTTKPSVPPYTLQLRLSETELWILKDKIQSDDVRASDKEFGLRLVGKVCEGLLELDRQEFF